MPPLTFTIHSLIQVYPGVFGGIIWMCACGATGSCPDRDAALDAYTSHAYEEVNPDA